MKNNRVFRLADTSKPRLISANTGKHAFTLAEVLITLGIIGVVAAMTLPTLIQKNQQRETVAKLKKTYSTMAQAIMQMNVEYGPMETWESSSPGEETKFFYERLTPYLKIIKDCDYSKEGCIATIYKKYSGEVMNGDPFVNSINNSRYNFILADGSAISLRYNNYPVTGNTLLAGIYIDVNGPKPPNTFGKDMFQFNLRLKEGFVPGNPSASYVKEVNDCLVSGYNCSYLVILNDNLDYQNCPDEFKAGATKCSK